jgi:hypothetical protein
VEGVGEEEECPCSGQARALYPRCEAKAEAWKAEGGVPNFLPISSHLTGSYIIQVRQRINARPIDHYSNVFITTI